MANTIQIKRGLEADRSGVTPAAGELLYTTDDKKVYIGDGSTAGGNPVAAGGAAIEATASGALANGDLVIVNSDGTVSTISSITETIGTPATFESADVYYTAATYDSTNEKVVIAYSDVGNSKYGTAVVGTVSGTSISFGTPVIFNSARSDFVSSTYDSANGKVVLAYQNQPTGYGAAIVGTVSGTSISFGTSTSFGSTGTYYVAATYDSVNEKVVIAYRATSNYGYARVGTVSGTSISLGTETVYNTGTTNHISPTYDSANEKVVIAYQDGSNSNYGTAIVGTVSGTNISFGSEQVFHTAQTTYISTDYDSSNDKVVIAYNDGSNVIYGAAIVGTVSGTSISFGAAVSFNNATTYYTACTYDVARRVVSISYRDGGNLNYGTVIAGTVSGTSISFGSEAVFETATTDYSSSTYDSANEKVVIAYRDAGGVVGSAVVIQNAGTTLTDTNYIGISDGAYADAATATVQIVGAVDDAQTGLTAGEVYYVQPDGTLSTTAGFPSVLAGTAISSTEIIVKG